MKPLIVRGRTLNPQGHALICTPLVARTAEALRLELAAISPKRPDVIEWRVDFFNEIADSARVLETASLIRAAAGAIPVIFTRRAVHEGGEAVTVAEDDVVALYEQVCASGAVDIIDYELSQDAANRARLRAASRAHGVALILSYHNFTSTPGSAELVTTLARAEQQGADIAKVAVMPKAPDDVLTLLSATLEANRRLKIPLITMSMGALGAMTRICGWQYGSVLTFAVGSNSSAPGQIAIDALRAALSTLEKASAPNGPA